MMQYKCSDILISLISFKSNEFRPKHDINLKKAFDCYDLDILKKTNSSGLKIILLTELNICG